MQLLKTDIYKKHHIYNRRQHVDVCLRVAVAPVVPFVLAANVICLKAAAEFSLDSGIVDISELSSSPWDSEVTSERQASSPTSLVISITTTSGRWSLPVTSVSADSSSMASGLSYNVFWNFECIFGRWNFYSEADSRKISRVLPAVRSLFGCIKRQNTFFPSIAKHYARTTSEHGPCRRLPALTRLALSNSKNHSKQRRLCALLLFNS